MSERYRSEFRGANHIEVLPEKEYDRRMTEEIEPELQRCRVKGYLTVVRGVRLHYEYYLCSDPVGAVVISHGFTESAEKFREMTYYFLQAGYSVFAPDHRGHGKSFRAVEDTSLTHIGKFSEYTEDLDLFIRKVVRPNAVNLPLYLYAHSMGGAIGAMYLSQNPVTFRRAVLTAPMIAPYTNGVPRWITAAIASFFCLIGKSRSRVFLFGEFDENESFAASPDTSRERFEYYRQKRLHYRHLRNTAPTYGWLRQAVGVTRPLLNRQNCSTVQTPVLLFQADDDGFVLPKPQNRYIERIPHGELIHVPETKHEIYMSKSEVLQPYLDRILTFYTK